MNENCFDVIIVIEDEIVNEKTGKVKVKKTREHHLVYGTTYKDVELKVKNYMKSESLYWSIKSIKESDVIAVYGKFDFVDKAEETV